MSKKKGKQGRQSVEYYADQPFDMTPPDIDHLIISPINAAAIAEARRERALSFALGAIEMSKADTVDANVVIPLASRFEHYLKDGTTREPLPSIFQELK